MAFCHTTPGFSESLLDLLTNVVSTVYILGLKALSENFETSETDENRALDALEKAYQERGEDLVWLRSDPEFDPLRSDPRFQDLLRRMNFPP